MDRGTEVTPRAGGASSDRPRGDGLSQDLDPMVVGAEKARKEGFPEEGVSG